MIPVLKCEVWWTDSPTDISADLRKAATVTITRGRADERGRIDPASCTFTLANDDGRYTIGKTDGANYPNVRRGKQVRISARKSDGSWSVRFTGWVTDWNTTDTMDGPGALCVVTASATKRSESRPLKAGALELVRAAGAVAYWPFTETEGEKFSEMMGNGYPTLSATQVGTSGTLELGTAKGLPIDGAPPVLQITNTSTTAGYLVKSPLMTLPAEFTVGLWLDTSAATVVDDGTFTKGKVLDLQRTSTSRLVVCRTGAHTFKMAMIAGGIPGASLTFTMTEPGILAVSVKAGGSLLDPPNIWVGGSGTAVSDRNVGGGLYAGADVQMSLGGGAAFLDSLRAGHLFILNRALTGTEMAALAANLSGTSNLPASDRIAAVLGWLGDSTPVEVWGTSRETVPVLTEGTTLADYAAKLAEGLGARYLRSREGSPLWIGTNYYPDPVSIPKAWISSGMEFGGTDYYSDGSATLPAGTTYTYSKTDPEEYGPADQITGVAANDYVTRALVQWIVNTGDGGGRVPQIEFDVTKLTDPDAEVVLGLDVASRLALADLPASLPANLGVVVEGYTETIGDRWTIVSNLSRDRNLFILGTSILGGSDVLGI